jgi:hypothetical protein
MYYIRTLAQGSFYVVKFKAQLLPGIVYIVAFAVRLSLTIASQISL